MKQIPFLLVVCAMAIGCSPDVTPNDPAKKVEVTSNTLEKPSDLLPLKVGNAWTYEVTMTLRTKEGTQSGSQTPTLKVTGLKGDRATLAFLVDNKVTSNVVLEKSDKGVAQVSVAPAGKPASSFSPPTPMFQWPMKVDGEVKWKGTGFRSGFANNGPMTSTLTYKGEYEVDTDAGRFKAHRFDSMQTYKINGKEFGNSSSTWFVPKVGIVRTAEVVATGDAIRESVMKLKSYTVK